MVNIEEKMYQWHLAGDSGCDVVPRASKRVPTLRPDRTDTTLTERLGSHLVLEDFAAS